MLADDLFINTGLQPGGPRPARLSAVSTAFKASLQTVETVGISNVRYCTGLKPGVNESRFAIRNLQSAIIN